MNNNNHEFAEPNVQDEEQESRSSLVWPSQAALKQSLLQELLGREQLQYGQEFFQVPPVCFSIIVNLVRFVNVRLRIDPRRLAYFSAWTVKLETRAQRTTPTVMGWVCIFEKEEFPKSQRKLYWLWILFQFGAGKTQQHFAASIIMYIYIYT